MTDTLPTPAQINQMNNSALKSALKDLVKRCNEAEKTVQLGIEGTDGQPTTNGLLQEILGEIKKFNADREQINEELKNLRDSNNLLLEAVAQQQRFLEEIDSEKRSKNLIVLGTPETDLKVGNKTAKTDLEKIELVLNTIGYQDPDIVSVQRLGKVNADAARSRPVKVVLQTAADRQKALSLVENLAQAQGGSLANIKIKKDTHPAIRKEFGRLFEVERQEKAKPENVGKVVEFDKRKRLITVDGLVVDRFKPSFFLIKEGIDCR